MPCLFSPLYGNHAHVTPINLQNRVKGVYMNKQTLIQVQKVNKEISIYRLIHSVTEVIIGLCASLLVWFSFSVFICHSYLPTPSAFITPLLPEQKKTKEETFPLQILLFARRFHLLPNHHPRHPSTVINPINTMSS